MVVEMLADILAGFKLAWRTRIPVMCLGVCGGALLAAWLASYFSGRQPSIVALDVGISFIRVSMPLIVILLVQELFSKEFERRYFLNSLSYPGARSKFLLGRFVSVLVVLLGALVFALFFLGLLVLFLSGVYGRDEFFFSGYVVYSMFMALDLILLATLAVFLSVVASTPGFILIGVLGFMIVARSFSTIVELLARNSAVVSDVESYRAGLGVLGYLLPDLAALDMRMLALYGRMDFLPADWPWLVMSCLSYSFALLALSVFYFNRKRFS